MQYSQLHWADLQKMCQQFQESECCKYLSLRWSNQTKCVSSFRRRALLHNLQSQPILADVLSRLPVSDMSITVTALMSSPQVSFWPFSLYDQFDISYVVVVILCSKSGFSATIMKLIVITSLIMSIFLLTRASFQNILRLSFQQK